ncbi:hypothetical protein [Pseudoduganella sp. R-34]|uniref:hypothetical protein n=1 Tax=Pseudoduganella sp. R-34 TaxID=3404062 RepID=UPI003CFB1F86
MNLANQYFYGPQDFLFSYGPLYWLTGNVTSQYSVASYWTGVVFLSVVFSLFWATIISMASAARSVFFLAGLFLVFFANLNFGPALFLWPFVLVVFLDIHRQREIRSGEYFLFGSLIAVAFYLRFFWGMAALATLGSYFFSRAFRTRQLKGLLLLVAGLLAGYVLIGLVVFHDYSSLVRYIIINKQLSFGNSVDMTLELTNSTGTWMAVALVAIALNVYLVLRKRDLLITVNVLFLLFFKLGFSRTDHYVPYFVIPVAMLMLLPLLDRSKLARAVLLVGTASLYYLLVMPSYPGAPGRKVFQPTVDLRPEYASRMESTYPGFKLNPEMLQAIGRNSIDIYPYNNEYAFANQLNYKYRPLFQNYMTLTPKLDAMNQAFFESADRPQFVLWTAGIACASADCDPFEAFDGKYSLNEDPLTTSAILLNYHVVKTGAGKGGIPLLLLEKNQTVKKYQESAVSAQQGMEFGKWYKVPKGADGLLKIKPELKFTLYGHAKNLLFRGSVLKVRFKFASGAMREYRANILNAGSGIAVTPLLNSFNLSGPAPVEIMFETTNGKYFQPSFDATWVLVPIAGLKVAQSYADARSASAPEHAQEKTITCEGAIDVINAERYTNQVMSIEGNMKVQGWLASATSVGELFDKTYLVITDSQGRKHYIGTRVENREDLTAAFKFERMKTAGYVSIVDLSFLDGPATIGLAGVKGPTLYTCSQFAARFNVKR